MYVQYICMYVCVLDKSGLSVWLAWFTPLCYAFFISPDPSICVWFDNLLSLFVTRTMLVQELTNELTFFCTFPLHFIVVVVRPVLNGSFQYNKTYRKIVCRCFRHIFSYFYAKQISIVCNLNIMGRSTTTATTRLLIKSDDLLERQRRCRCRCSLRCRRAPLLPTPAETAATPTEATPVPAATASAAAIARQSLESYQHNSDFSAFTLFLISRFASSFSVFVLFSFLFH